jgi:hypothetical protein
MNNVCDLIFLPLWSSVFFTGIQNFNLALNRSENEKYRSQIFYMVIIVVAIFY